VAVAGHFYNDQTLAPLYANYYAPTFARTVAGATSLGLTTYGGVQGSWGTGSNTAHPFWANAQGLQTYTGIFSNRSNLTMGQLTALDGTAHTLMIGEGIGGPRPSGTGPPDYSATWMGYPGLPAVGGIPADTSAQWYHYSSRHPGIVQFCFGDGSVRALKKGNSGYVLGQQTPPTTDWYVVQEMAGCRDGGSRDRSGLE
jgi:hypothetical protein